MEQEPAAPTEELDIETVRRMLDLTREIRALLEGVDSLANASG
jgi:hypothetical protein